MADDIISGSEGVYTKQICDNLILIDPNKIESELDKHFLYYGR